MGEPEGTANVGDVEGRLEGHGLGATEGATLGLPVSELDGLQDFKIVGRAVEVPALRARDGSLVGLEGAVEGSGDGPLGSMDGTVLGILLGVIDGTDEGFAEGFALGTAVLIEDGDAVGFVVVMGILVGALLGALFGRLVDAITV